MKKTVSLLLTGLMAFSSVAVAGTASAVDTATVNDQVCKVGGTVSYTYNLKTPGTVEDFQGELDYSSGLTLETFTLSETKGMVLTNTDIEGAAYYSGSSPVIGDQQPYDFTGGVTLITAKFRVKEGGSQTIKNKMELITGIDGTQYYDFGKNISTEESEKTTADFYAVEHFTLDKTSLSLFTGDTQEIKATVDPVFATNTDVTWTTSNDQIAAVTANDTKATITAVAPGKAVITAQCDGKTATCEVTVSDKEVLVTSLTTDTDKVELPVGSTKKVTATYAPANATDPAITWSSSNTSVATVTNDGDIKAVGKGTAEIIVAANDGSNIIAKISVTVTQPVTKLTVTKSATVKVKQKVTLKAKITPSSADNKSLAWSSNKKSVAKVSAKGVVTGVKKGTATITVKTKDGSNLSAKCKVTVTQPVTKITLNKTKLTLKVKKTFTLKANVKPSNANNKKVKWSTSKKSVATVSAKGVVKAVKKGTAVIKAVAKDGSKKSAKCTVTVKK